jgi:hypothetical protein
MLAIDIVMRRSQARCRNCGCTDTDCTGCVVRTGRPCFWVLEDLCSACAPLEVLLEQSLARVREGAPLDVHSCLTLRAAGRALERAALVHAVNPQGDCAAWCRACEANVQAGRNPDGTPIEGVTTGAVAAAAGQAPLEQDEPIAHVKTGESSAGRGLAERGAGGTDSASPQHCAVKERTALLRAYPAQHRRLWDRIKDYAVITGGDPETRGSLIASGAVEQLVGELMDSARRDAWRDTRIGRAPDLLVRLWEAVSKYTNACGGDMSARTVNDRRMDAVLAVEAAVAAIAHDACRTAQAFARGEGWRRLARAIGEPGLELDPELLVARIIEHISVLDACKMPDDDELGGLVRAAAGLGGGLIRALRDLAEAASGEPESMEIRRAFRKLGEMLQNLLFGRLVEGAIDFHVDDVAVVREVLSRSGYLRDIETVAAWTSEQRRTALVWAFHGRLADPPEDAPEFLQEGGDA